MPRPPSTLFEDAIDVPAWLETDRATPYAERVRRDRLIGRETADRRPLERVRRWWRAVGPEGDTAGARLARIRAFVTLAMVLLGFVAGTAVALAAFRYDGSEPVNVVRVLALLVALPLLLLLLSLLLLPGRVPGLRGLQDALAGLSPGALAGAVFRRLAHPPPDLERLFDFHSARATAGRFAKWQLLFWSQASAVAFNLAALATAVLLVTFTDLAFGWSTTLSADPAIVARIVQAVAWPWHALVPAAVPDLALVERSQFFRLGAGSFDAEASRALTGWWPFTVMAIVTYGLLPRLALLVLSAGRLRAATRALLLDDPRVTALLDRMAAPALESGAEVPAERPEPGGPAAARRAGRLEGSARAVIWSNSIGESAAREYARRHLGLEIAVVASAGGGRTVREDEAALERLAERDGRTLLVFTPAWEPPLLEFADFVAAVRRRIGESASIVVVPVPDAPRAVTEVERDTWSRAVARLPDPRVYLETGAA
ncbi:MAG TPA: DUF2868 domain-containing protein [Gammaproteobacteria bacterium]